MKRVYLLDPMLATGGSASMAIQKIVEKNVSPEKIVFINLISCDEGIQKLLTDYPSIKILTAVIDPEINDQKYILPGLGDFGDRYFGTKQI